MECTARTTQVMVISHNLFCLSNFLWLLHITNLFTVLLNHVVIMCWTKSVSMIYWARLLFCIVFFLFSISFFWSWYVSVNLSLNQLWFHLFKKNVNVAKHIRTITFWNFDNIYLFHSKANHFDHCYNCVSFYVGSFVVKNKPADGKRFIRLLGKVSTLSFLPLLLVIPCIYWEHSPKNKVLSLCICKENYYHTQSFECVFS
jgi:lysylphosphatidylglycerol synthetase-like protein (DUF2156 family)